MVDVAHDANAEKLAALDRSLAIVEFTPKGEILSANGNFLAMLGYEREEVIGRHHEMFVDPLEVSEERHRVFWQRLAAGAYQAAEYRRIGKHGREVWIQGTYTPLYDADGVVHKIVKVAMDVTQIKLRNIGDQARMSAIEHTQGVAEFELDGVISEVNENFLRLTGYERHELIGRHHSVLVDPEYRKSLEYVTFWNGLRRGEFKTAEFKRVKKSGEPFWLHATYSLVLDLSGRPYRIIKIASDISDRKELEHKARASQEAKELFLGSISHELRTPLNGVSAMAALLGESNLDARQREMVSLIQGAGETLDRLVSDILDLGRMNAGAMSLDVQPMDLDREMGVVAALVRDQAQKKGLDFQVSCELGGRRHRLGDATRVRQIVLNLLSNAIKFTPSGSVSLRVAASAWDDGVEFCVIDTGVGFDQACSDKIFEPFEQADVTISRRFGGSGLGLSIARRLAHLMGGSLTAASKPGQGSVFTFHAVFPECEPIVLEEAVEHIEAGSLAGLSVLVVEDNIANQRVASLILDSWGCEVILAGDGREGVEALASRRFDAVLMDMQMPGMDGLTATRLMRKVEERHGWGRTPIIMLSANASEARVAQALAAGCDRHVEKPLTLSSLYAALASLAPAGRIAANDACAA